MYLLAHNMRGYDSHLIIKYMEKKFTCEDIRVIANNKEKFMAFQIGQLRFLDSLQFLNASLDTLVSNLKKDGPTYFKHTQRHFPDPDSSSLVAWKGIFPCEWSNGPEKFEETSLPPIEKFYSKLYDSTISQEDYSGAQDVWNHFNFKRTRVSIMISISRQMLCYSLMCLRTLGEWPSQTTIWIHVITTPPQV